MKKSLKSAVVILFAVVLSFVLVTGQPAQADKGKTKVKGPPTLVKELESVRNQVHLSEGRLTCDTQGSCNSDTDLSDECKDFVLECFSVADPQGCIGGGVFICEEEELPSDTDEDNVCDIAFCIANEKQRTKCLAFLGGCLDNLNLPEKCLAGSYWICTNPFHNKIGL